MKQLSTVLREIDDLRAEQDLKDSQEKQLNELSQECFRTLSNLEKYLDKYHVLDRSNGKSDKPKRIWKRITWDQSEIQSFRSSIEANLDNYNLFLTAINRYVGSSNCSGASPG